MRTSKIKILIVEDEAIVARDIQACLRNLGYKSIRISPSAEKAFDEIDIEKPDLILMDIILKGKIDGIEAATLIREQHQVPVVFLTANADNKTIEKAKVAEPYGYIIKPFREKELQTAIEMALYKHERDAMVIHERDFFYQIVEKDEVQDSFYIRSDMQLHRIKFNDIYFVESHKDFIIINTVDNSYSTKTTIKDVAKLLPPRDFCRVHRSFIVRLDKIFSIKFPDLIIEDKKKIIPIGGIYKKELYSRFNFIYSN